MGTQQSQEKPERCVMYYAIDDYILHSKTSDSNEANKKSRKAGNLGIKNGWQNKK
jgi:hypothetical protein